jgi:hypothetical protein
MAVNIANFRLAKETKSKVWISLLAALSCLVALIALCWQTWSIPSTRSQLWILVGMILSSFLIEIAYRTVTKRKMHMGYGRTPKS